MLLHVFMFTGFTGKLVIYWSIELNKNSVFLFCNPLNIIYQYSVQYVDNNKDVTFNFEKVVNGSVHHVQFLICKLLCVFKCAMNFPNFETFWNCVVIGYKQLTQLNYINTPSLKFKQTPHSGPLYSNLVKFIFQLWFLHFVLTTKYIIFFLFLYCLSFLYR